jgi:hypothetical protein
MRSGALSGHYIHAYIHAYIHTYMYVYNGMAAATLPPPVARPGRFGGRKQMPPSESDARPSRAARLASAFSPIS